MIRPLNAAERNAARSYGWTYVGGVVDAFQGHGYGADRGARWIRTASESRDYQGPHHNALIGAIGGAALGAAWLGPGATAAAGAVFGGLAGAEAVRVMDKIQTKGTLHPNEEGHRQIARLVLGKIHLDSRSTRIETRLAPLPAGPLPTPRLPGGRLPLPGPEPVVLIPLTTDSPLQSFTTPAKKRLS